MTRKIVDGALRCRLEPGFRLRLGDLSAARDWGWAEEYVEAMQLILRSDEIEDQVLCIGWMETFEYFVARTFRRLDLDWRDHVDLQESLRRPSEILCSVEDPGPMRRVTAGGPEWILMG